MIKLVLSDLDGTIVPFGKKKTSKRTNQAVQKLREANIHFAPATGRPPKDAYEMMRCDNVMMQTAILANGRILRLDDSYLTYKPMDRESLVQTFEIVTHFRDSYLCLEFEDSRDFVSSKRQWVMTPSTYEEFQIARNEGLNSVVTHYSEEFPNKEVLVAGIATRLRDEDAKELVHAVEEACTGLSLIGVNNRWTDILTKGTSKADGIKPLMDAMGIQKDEILYIGDSGNDIPMFKELIHTVCVENASADVKELARYEIAHAEEDGPAQLMEQLAANNGDIDVLMSYIRA